MDMALNQIESVSLAVARFLSADEKIKFMKHLRYSIAVFCLAVLAACSSSNPLGNKVKEPFSGSKYESSSRYFRAKGKGESSDENMAKQKADLNAKKELAQQVETRIKVVSDRFLDETSANGGSDLKDKFISLTREVTNTTIADVRKLGEEKYFNQETGKYSVFIAYEIHKRDMFRFLKKQAKLDAKLNEAERKAIEDMIDEELKEIEALGEGD